MRLKMDLLKPVVATAMTFLASGAQADIGFYTDQTAFLAAVSQPMTDTFNDLSFDLLPSGVIRSAGGYSYEISAGPSDGGFYAAGSPSDPWLAPTVATDVMRFSQFSPGVYAFGGNFFGSDVYGVLDPGRTVVLTASAGSQTENVTLLDATSSSFLGFISSTPLTSITVASQDETGQVYWATANNVVLAVPEPGTYAMLVAGLTLMSLAGQRRTRPAASPGQRT